MKILKAFKLWSVFTTLEKEEVKETKMSDPAAGPSVVVTPGWKTSEFWLSLLPQVPVVLGVFLGSTNPITLGIGAVCALGYTLSRAYVKGQASQALVAAAQAASTAAQNAVAP